VSDHLVVYMQTAVKYNTFYIYIYTVLWLGRVGQYIWGPKQYTPPPGLGKENKNMAGVDHFLVYMQTALEYSSLYIHHPGGAALID